MRTRFLNTDYFTSSSSPVETLNFLNLPVPHISPSRVSTSKDDILRFAFVFDISLEIEQLPIASAVSKFLSVVIPEELDFNYRDLEALRFPVRDGGDDEKELDILFVEKEEKSRVTFRCETLKQDNEIVTSRRSELFQFETPELAAFVVSESPDNASYFDDEDFGMLSKVPYIDNCLDMVEPGILVHRLVHRPDEVQESIILLEDVALNHNMEQNTFLLDDGDDSLPDQMICECHTFPLLEVDEISFGYLTNQSMEDVLLSVLENTEHQHWIRTRIKAPRITSGDSDTGLNIKNDNMLTIGEEIVGSMECDILDLILDHHWSKQRLEAEGQILNMVPEMDIISMVENTQLKENTESHQVMADGDSLMALSPLIFQEFHTFDVDSYDLFELFLWTQTTREPVTCNSVFSEEMNFKNFNELITSQELALTDGTFKSLPIPLLSDYKEKNLSLTTLVKILAELKTQPLSASDAIYLDWHILEEEKCSKEIFYHCEKMVEDIDAQSTDFVLEPSGDEKLLSNFIFSDDAISGPNVERSEEAVNLNIYSHGNYILDGHPMGVASNKLLGAGSSEFENGKQSAEKDTERLSCLFKSTSQFNDLEFFLNRQKTITQEHVESTINKLDTFASSSSSLPACLSNPSNRKNRKMWDITLHKVKLSDIIVTLVDVFARNYLAILQNETAQNSGMESDDYNLLSLPKQQLMDCIRKKLLQKSTSHGDENIVTFVTLCAIKHVAWYTCFYGIHTAHLYVHKLCQNVEDLKLRLGSLRSLIMVADEKVNKQITTSHPSLSVIQGIILSNKVQSNRKVLILAEQIFWWSLKGLLMSMGLSCNELQNLNTHVDQTDECNTTNSGDAELDALLNTDYLLASHEFVSESFPFNKFSLIVEYGGPYGSSRVSALSPTVAGLPHLHFLKVELDDSSASRALCEGVDVPQNMKAERDFQSTANFKDGLKLLKMLSFLPVANMYDVGSCKAPDAGCMPSLVPSFPTAEKTEQMQQSPETIIIVNTQSFDKEMIVSRRSTYQRILAMEKEGIQVVERDSDLPVDVLISSAICLVWYDCENIGKKATAFDEASSSLPLYVENIATNVLMLLSLTFSGCILVFEGEVGFISTIMESSDGLYAAAASLGIDLQLFCSYSSELTNEIILSCIRNSFKMTKGLYPKMPDSETLAESFLVKFPSVNPLTAHAMLSLGGMLIEFFECSHECRILSLQKYHAPDESIILFSTLCKFGEREDSKSILTDCSSSVSSGPDSHTYLMNTFSAREMRKYISSPDKVAIHKNELEQCEPLNLISDGIWNLPGESKSNDSRKDHEIFDQYEKQELDFNIILPPKVSKPYDSQIQNGSKNSDFYFEGKWLDQNQESELAWINSFDRHNIIKSKNLHEGFIGEVIDHSSPVKDFSLKSNSLYSSSSMAEMKDSRVRKSKIVRRLSLGNGNHPNFPTAAEINFGSDIFSSQGQRQCIVGDETLNIYHNDKFPSDHQKNLVEEVLARKSAGIPTGPFQEEISCYGRTPLSDAIRSPSPQPGSPWTIEFLNKIREKSRLRQQSFPRDTTLSCPGPGNISKSTKRRSPSILEFFKYQGGSIQKNLPEQKKQKRSVQSSTSFKNSRAPASFPATLTPIDKRARKTLAFEMNESGGQTTLIWNDENDHGPRRKFSC